MRPERDLVESTTGENGKKERQKRKIRTEGQKGKNEQKMKRRAPATHGGPVPGPSREEERTPRSCRRRGDRARPVFWRGVSARARRVTPNGERNGPHPTNTPLWVSVRVSSPKGRAGRPLNGQMPYGRARADPKMMPDGWVNAAPIARPLCRSVVDTTPRARGPRQVVATGV
eukprot:scaffold52796_cov67-Phaeocystis_antarctica.AAC.2